MFGYTTVKEHALECILRLYHYFELNNNKRYFAMRRFQVMVVKSGNLIIANGVGALSEITGLTTQTIRSLSSDLLTNRNYVITELV